VNALCCVLFSGSVRVIGLGLQCSLDLVSGFLLNIHTHISTILFVVIVKLALELDMLGFIHGSVWVWLGRVHL